MSNPVPPLESIDHDPESTKSTSIEHRQCIPKTTETDKNKQSVKQKHIILAGLRMSYKRCDGMTKAMMTTFVKQYCNVDTAEKSYRDDLKKLLAKGTHNGVFIKPTKNDRICAHRWNIAKPNKKEYHGYKILKLLKATESSPRKRGRPRKESKQPADKAKRNKKKKRYKKKRTVKKPPAKVHTTSVRPFTCHKKGDDGFDPILCCPEIAREDTLYVLDTLAQVKYEETKPLAANRFVAYRFAAKQFADRHSKYKSRYIGHPSHALPLVIVNEIRAMFK
eukprot:1404_1